MISENNRILVQGSGYLPVKNFAQQKVELWDGEQYVNAEVSEAKTCPQFILSFRGGDKFTCCPEQKLRSLVKGFQADTEAKDLRHLNHVFITKSTPKFDFMKTSFPLDNEEVGFLTAVFWLYEIQSNELWIPAHEFELIKSLKQILSKCGVTYTEDVQHSRKRILTKIFFTNLEFCDSVRQLCYKGRFTDKVWTSKNFFVGFIKPYLNCGDIVPKEFLSVKDVKQLTFDLRTILYLFGVKADVSKGLLHHSNLLIYDENILRLALAIAGSADSRFIKPLDLRKLETLVDKCRKPLTLSVSDGMMVNKMETMYEVQSESRVFMTNGIICNSEE